MRFNKKNCALATATIVGTVVGWTALYMALDIPPLIWWRDLLRACLLRRLEVRRLVSGLDARSYQVIP